MDATKPLLFGIPGIELESKKGLQEQLSYVLEYVCSKAPILKNELVNRNKASAQGNSAKNKLVPLY